ASKLPSPDTKVVDVLAARNYKFEPTEFTYTQRDVMLYAVGIGASRRDLNIVYELSPDFQTFPTFAFVCMFNSRSNYEQFIPTFNPMMLVHIGQSVEFFREVPTSATLSITHRVVDIIDKPKGIVLITGSRVKDKESDVPICESETTLFIAGIGGFSKAAGYKSPPSADRLRTALISGKTPEPPPNKTVIQKTSPEQAVLYRLLGSYNPLHIDPEMAAKGNFKAPILHGLCTLGFSSRHLVNEMAGGDARKLKALKVSFSSPVYPGETIQTNMWIDKSNPNRVLFSAKLIERDIIVIANAFAEFSEPPKFSIAKSNL
ncbi:Peroxisomal multifunctional enzyme type 2, partial [Smittium culicis]